MSISKGFHINTHVTSIKIYFLTCSSVPKEVALQSYEKELPDHFAKADEWAQKQTDSFDVDAFDEWLDAEKKWVSQVVHDCKDAKRRVGLAKGPKPKPKSAPPKTDESASDEAESESVEPTS